MGINRLTSIKDYWSVEEGLGNPLIQKAMTRARFWEILQKMHFADNLQNVAHSMIGKFSNRKRSAPTHRPSKKSKGESFDTVDHLPEFVATHARCSLCSSKKIESRSFIRCLSCNTPLCLQKETVFIYTTPSNNNKHDYFLDINICISSLDSFSA